MISTKQKKISMSRIRSYRTSHQNHLKTENENSIMFDLNEISQKKT